MATTDTSNSFGVLDNFKVGDVVLWSRLGIKLTGVVSDLYLNLEGGREVAYASVFCFENQQKLDVLCVNLKILTKNEVEDQKN